MSALIAGAYHPSDLTIGPLRIEPPMRLSTHDGVDASVRERNRLGLAVMGLYTRAPSEESGAHFGIRLDRDDLMS
jgi:hypothetical protein